MQNLVNPTFTSGYCSTNLLYASFRDINTYRTCSVLLIFSHHYPLLELSLCLTPWSLPRNVIATVKARISFFSSSLSVLLEAEGALLMLIPTLIANGSTTQRRLQGETGRGGLCSLYSFAFSLVRTIRSRGLRLVCLSLLIQ